jgi:hypothetical protein
MPASAPPARGGVLKVILVVLGVLFLLMVVSIAGLVYIGYRAKKALRASRFGKTTTITTPFGNMTTNQENAAQTAADMGVDVYPGAVSVKGTGATVKIGGMTVGAVTFETGDSVSAVGAFYRAKFPQATVTSTDEDRQSIVAMSDKGMVTIAIERRDSGTHISISRMSGMKMQ